MNIVNFERFNIFSLDNNIVVVDCPPGFTNLMSSQGFSSFNFVMVTDPKKCLGLKFLAEYLEERDIDRVQVYVLNEHVELLKSIVGTPTFLEYKVVEPMKEFSARTVEKCAGLINGDVGGYVFSDLAFDIFRKLWNIFKDKKFIYVDTKDYGGAVKFFLAAKPTECCLHNEDYSVDKEGHFKNDLGDTAWLANNGLTFDIHLSRSEVLYCSESTFAVEPILAEEIWKGTKTNILLNSKNNNLINSLSYLVKNDFAFGLLKLKHPLKIKKSDAMHFVNEHLLSDEKIQEKFGNKQVIYSYDFDIVDLFPAPKVVEWADDVTRVVKSVKEFEPLLSNDTQHLLKSNYFLSVNSLDNTSTIKQLRDAGVSEKIIDIYSSNRAFNLSGVDEQKNVCDLGINHFKKINELSSIDLNDKLFAFPLIEPLLTISKNNDCVTTNPGADVSVELSESMITAVNNSCGSDFVLSASIRDNAVEVFDVLFLGGLGNLKSKPYEQRFKILRDNFNFSNKFTCINPVILNNPSNVHEHISRLSNNFNSAIGLIPAGDSHIFMLYSEKFSDIDCFNEPIELSGSADVKNESFFSTWSSEMAYFLGFLSTDGYLDNKSNRIEFGIHPQDRDIIDKFASLVGGVKPKMMDSSLVLRFKSKKMAEDLVKLGMAVTKPTRTTYAKVPETYIWDYIRGVFDADGNVGKDRLQVDNNAYGLLNFLVKHFKTIAGDDVKYYRYEGIGKIVVLNSGAVKLKQKIYSGSGPCSARKKSSKLNGE